MPTPEGNSPVPSDVSMGDVGTMVGSAGASPEAPDEDDLIDDRYEVVETLGTGGMGRVYRCRDRKLDRDVAVKRLLSDMNASREGIERFLREGRTIAGLNHRNIVQIFDLGEDEKGHYIVMELVAGGTLKDLVREGGKLSLELSLIHI